MERAAFDSATGTWSKESREDTARHLAAEPGVDFAGAGVDLHGLAESGSIPGCQ